MKIAIPAENGLLCPHFGRCQQVAFVDVDPKSGEINTVEYYSMPEHAPGVFPKFVAQKGAEIVLAGGMGPQAVDILSQLGVKVIVGCPVESPQNLATMYVNGELTPNDNTCDHH